ncbi:MAG: hypothetical protein DRG83_11755 [Deltaproteobacteria bacterium]|nr:MAG: hypothetical protein DRG83_11755 [Deltaproteobacteria bacterium]
MVRCANCQTVPSRLVLNLRLEHNTGQRRQSQFKITGPRAILFRYTHNSTTIAYIASTVKRRIAI